jgi:hypothetical protein
MPRVAFQDAAHCEIASLENAIFFKGSETILRT